MGDALARQNGTQRLMLIVDQWEELYTLTESKDERDHFIDEILDASAASSSPFNVVLTLRGDFIGKAFANRRLSDRLQGAQLNLGPMTPEELRKAIEEPARKIGLQFQDGLVNLILSDVGNEPGNLPLLEFVLRELWQERQYGVLHFDAYIRMGGISGAIAAKAEALYEKLDVAGQNEARRLFIQLVHTTDSGNNTRRREFLSNVPSACLPLVKRLTDERLLVTSGESASGEEQIEVSHEALIRSWKRLVEWLEKDRAFFVWLERFRVMLESWERNSKSEELLLRGPALAETNEWNFQMKNAFTDIQRTFLELSLDKEKRTLDLDKRVANRFRLVATIATIFALFAMVSAFAVYAQKTKAVSQTEEAKRQREAAFIQQKIAVAEKRRAENAEAVSVIAQKESEDRRLFAEAKSASKFNPELSVLLLAEALKQKNNGSHSIVQPTFQTLFSILAEMPSIPLQSPFESVICMATSKGGRWLAAGRADGTVALRDFTIKTCSEGTRILRLKGGSVNIINMSPDERWLVAGALDGSANAWCIDSQREPFDLTPKQPNSKNQFLTCILFSENHECLLAYNNGELRLFKVGTPIRDNINESDKFEELREPLRLGLASGVVINSMTIPMGARRVFAGCSDGSLLTINISGSPDSYKSTSIFRHKGPIKCVVSSPDGKWIASGGEDSAVLLSEVGGSEYLKGFELKGNEGGITSLLFSVDSSKLLVGGRSGIAQVWSVSSKPSLEALPRQAVSAYVRVPPEPDKAFEHGSWDLNAVRQQKDQFQRFKEGSIFDEEAIIRSDIEFRSMSLGLDNSRPSAPKGLRIVTKSLVDLHVGGITALAGSPTGNRFAIGDAMGKFDVWQIEKSQKMFTCRGHSEWITKIEFGRDGSSIFTTGWDSRIRLWPCDITLPTYAEEFIKLDGNLDAYRKLGERVRKGDIGKLTNQDTDLILKIAEERCGRNFSFAEWQTYFPKRPYSKTFGGLP